MNTIKVQNNKEFPNLIHWGGDDPFTHTLIVGPTRCGKTSTLLEPLILSILLAKKRGEKVGLSVIEPKGDVARMVKEMAEEMGLKDDLVYIDPLFPKETNRINVMKGDKDDVAEATVAVLKSLFGKQDAFFATVQELSSRKVTLLLKELRGDDMDIMDVLANLRDASLLEANVELLRKAQGNSDLVQFFDNELLGQGNMAEKYRQFIVGLRAQLENITANQHLRAIVTGKSDIDLEAHMESGGILAVNSALGLLGKSGDAFGMFIAMHLQLATFRRRGSERTRVPHYLIIDEFSRYINPDIERFLSIAASYRVALIAAIQSLGQLEIESGLISGRAMKRAILTSTRNKIIFGGLEHEDAEEASKIMGKNMMIERTRSFDGGILQNVLPKMYKDEEEEKERFTPTFFMDGLPRFHYVFKILQEGTPQEPKVGVGDFVPRDWKEQLEAEEHRRINLGKPSVFRWRDRFKYQVDQQRLFESNQRLERTHMILAENPFEDETPAPLKNDNFVFNIGGPSKSVGVPEEQAEPPTTRGKVEIPEMPTPKIVEQPFEEVPNKAVTDEMVKEPEALVFEIPKKREVKSPVPVNEPLNASLTVNTEPKSTSAPVATLEKPKQPTLEENPKTEDDFW